MKKIYALTPLFFLFVITASISHAQKTVLYGTSFLAGVNNGAGTIFKVDSTGAITDLHDFSSTNGDGYCPQGCSLMVASDGLMYGMTYLGGKHYYCGTVYSFDVKTNTETVVHNCVGKTGTRPLGQIIEATNGLLYGLMTNGSDTAGDVFNDSGTIFSYNFSTSAYNVVHTFADSVQDGWQPNSSLMQANNELLYGMTEFGGVDSGGVLYSLDITSGKYTIAHSFASNKTDGFWPWGALYQVGNLLYGCTQSGGADSVGTIFTYNIINGDYNIVYNFKGYPIDGEAPDGSFIEVNNLLYGLTYNGGVHGAGTIFSYDINSGTETDLHDFEIDTVIDGALPTACLTQGSDGKLYGVTFYGGTNSKDLNNSDGVIFNYDISSGKETDLYNGYGANILKAPGCKLIEYIIPTVSGVNKLSADNEQIKIYPNPTSGTITVKINSVVDIMGWKLQVNDILGRTILTEPSLNYDNDIDMFNLDNGIYFISVVTKTGSTVYKVVKE